MSRVPTLLWIADCLATRFRDFARERRGVAALEFALIAPLMLLLYVGVVELTQALANSRKVTLLSRTLADLAARGIQISQSEADAIFSAGSAVLAPFDSSTATMTISSIGVYKVGSDYKAYVCSSAAPSPPPLDPRNPLALRTNPPIRPVGLPVAVNGLPSFPPIPEAFKQDKMRYVLAEVDATYTYVLGDTYEALKLKAIKLLPEQTTWPVRAGKPYFGNTNPEIVLPSAGLPCPPSIP